MKILYKIKSGSHLYGLNTEKSDIDYSGVYIEDELYDYMDVFKNKDELDLSFKCKQENGKNVKDAIDEKYFHITKFIKLLTENNPNIVEMLFCPEDCILYIDPVFKKYFIDNGKMFISKKIINKFIGYAISQEQKSYTKSKNYLVLDRFRTVLNNINKSFVIADIIDDAFKRAFENVYTIVIKKHSKTNIEQVLNIGDMQFPSGVTVEEAIKRIDLRFRNASHRIDGMLINKYEPKFMSHTIRLLDEGIQLLKTGKIELPFTGDTKQLIMDIKNGNTPVEKIPNIVNHYKDMLQSCEKETILPNEPDYLTIKNRFYFFIKVIYNITLNQ